MRIKKLLTTAAIGIAVVTMTAAPAMAAGPHAAQSTQRPDALGCIVLKGC